MVTHEQKIQILTLSTNCSASHCSDKVKNIITGNGPVTSRCETTLAPRSPVVIVNKINKNWVTSKPLLNSATPVIKSEYEDLNKIANATR